MLAKKFASLYYLLEDLLSPQKHYDWGLRAIKSVLVVAGSLLRAEEGQLESIVLFRALRDLNIAKILAQVCRSFLGMPPPGPPYSTPLGGIALSAIVPLIERCKDCAQVVRCQFTDLAKYSVRRFVCVAVHACRTWWSSWAC